MEGKLTKWCVANLIWIIGVLVACGALVFTVKNHDLLIDAQEAKIISLFKVASELKVQDSVVSTKLDMMIGDLSDIKSDLKEIKRSMPRVTNDRTTPSIIAKIDNPTK